MSVSTADVECATLTYEGSRDYERNDRDGHERRVELRDHRLELLRVKAEPSDCRIRGVSLNISDAKEKQTYR